MWYDRETRKPYISYLISTLSALSRLQKSFYDIEFERVPSRNPQATFYLHNLHFEGRESTEPSLSSKLTSCGPSREAESAAGSLISSMIVSTFA